MCGIVGILSLEDKGAIDRALLNRMLQIIRHRGPDESGVYLDLAVGLGSVRLSIIGVEGGTQPIGNEDESLWIVYNGEAFNYIELKADLIKKGHKFKTSTDTEVVLHLYEEHGPECLRMINGQFALAIWNVSEKELFLARDRVGIRPLYYTKLNHKFIFSSEIKAIFVDPDVPRKIDLKSMDQIFTFWSTITPGTIFENIYSVQPGHYMVVKNGQISERPFWKIPACDVDRNGLNFEETQEELVALLKDAVRLRLRADVPVGAYLSGGLDSSITTALISKCFNNRLRTFSMSFQEDAFDETSYQQNLVELLGTEHSRALISNEDIQNYFPDVIWHCETPLLRTAPVPLFLLSKLVRENNFKVVLTGEGADEVFGGYNIFKEAKVRHFWGKRPESKLRPLLLQKLYPYVFDNPARGRFFLQKFFGVKPEDLKDPFFSHRIRWQNSGKNTSFFSEDVLADLRFYQPFDEVANRLPADFDSYDTLAKAQLLEMDIFLSNYLLCSQGDRVAMANSLEIRLPFLDYRVIDFGFRLPARWKIRGLDEKHILKRSFQGYVPDSIRLRPKQPYRAPIQEVFFGGKSAEYVKELLTESYVKSAGYFNANKVVRLVARFNRADHSSTSELQNMALVGILSTHLIHQQFVEGFPRQLAPTFQPEKCVIMA